ncbi:BCS1 N terminal-domain-containing protein [Bombardia bombarda]|uniref:BCS1 N terminal-domain-containing protein n=1 Tax=Bombardia bombarda TaxID=252184 RepID=A0AA39XQV7_9PEZI|nr:BCS1 N terminal-domain-containing protein [Bombardia bombarda]
MNSLMALASTTSLLGVGSSASMERSPGFAMLQNFFKRWFKLDITTVLTIAALMGAASSGISSLRAASSKAYWWIVRFLTASISIAGNDRLNREVLNWIGAQVLSKSGSRILTAHSETIQSDAWYYRRVTQERNDLYHDKRVPVQYLPTFGTTWFFYGRNVFMVRRILTGNAHYKTAWGSGTPDEYAGAPQGDEPLVVMCLGRSVEPIKRFLHACRDFADKQRESFVTVRAAKRISYEESWDTTILRPLRPLETIHFDEIIKEKLISDIGNYLDVNTRKFYNSRGIPYRRGYLLHGPPGTGKTSLSLAIAGHFGLELYLLHIPSVTADASLEKLFAALPPRCIVLLEDIDAVGIKRRPAKAALLDAEDSSDSESDVDPDERPATRCTLSGLLNVLDGVASQEGRIVFMTSNFAEKLDKALVRPGRVDNMIYLGNISQRSAELMFLRMYALDTISQGPSGKIERLPEDQLQKLALDFSNRLPDDVFTPAQLQGYLLSYRTSPTEAVENIEAWVKDEQAVMDEAQARAAKMAERRKKRLKAARARAKTKVLITQTKEPEVDFSKTKASEIDSEAELEKLKVKMLKEEEKSLKKYEKKNGKLEDAGGEKDKDGEGEGEKVSQDKKSGEVAKPEDEGKKVEKEKTSSTEDPASPGEKSAPKANGFKVKEHMTEEPSEDTIIGKDAGTVENDI